MKTYRDLVSEGRSDVAAQLAEQSDRMRDRMSSVRHVVAVMSGKGGVGKSTLSANLAAALLRTGSEVGLVDADINGPSIGAIAGVRGYVPAENGSGLIPALAYGGLRVMSIGFFLSDETAPVLWDAVTHEHAFAWRGLREAGALRELIADTNWGRLDYLIVDLPPGADRLSNLTDVLPSLSGAVAVTIPSDVSAAAVGKAIRAARECLTVPILGLVENMSGSVCPHCGRTDDLFPKGGTDRLAEQLRIPVLARIPFDPALAAAADRGRCYLDEHGERPAARSISSFAARLATRIAAVDNISTESSHRN